MENPKSKTGVCIPRQEELES